MLFCCCARAFSSGGAWASHCGGFSSCRAQALDLGLSSHGSRASLLHGMWDLPEPRIKLMSPCTGWQILNHWITRELPVLSHFSHVRLFVTIRTEPAKLLSPWDSPGKITGVDCHALLQRIFPTQGWNLGLPHCRWILYCQSHQGSHNNYNKMQEEYGSERTKHLLEQHFSNFFDLSVP